MVLLAPMERHPILLFSPRPKIDTSQPTLPATASVQGAKIKESPVKLSDAIYIDNVAMFSVY